MFGKDCIHCGKPPIKDGNEEYDACLGKLAGGVMNACCGHGGHAEGAYVQFSDGNTIHGQDALIVIEILKKLSPIIKI